MKIGQELQIKEDFKINTIVSNKVITVKQGDKGFIDSVGHLHITTGNGKGKVVKINNAEVKGYDYENISKLILNRLNSVFGLEEYFKDEDIDSKEVIDEIEYILMEIL